MKILVVGIGELGRRVATDLSLKGYDVVAVDVNSEKCQALAREADVMVINRDATDPSLYEELELGSFDVVIASTDRDEVNLFVAAVAKEYGVGNIVVVTRTAKASELIEMLGLADVTFPSPIVSAKLVLSYIEGKYGIVELTKVLSGKYGIYSIEITSGDSSVGMKISEIKEILPKDVMILAVFNGEQFVEPEEELTLEPGYILILLAPVGREEEIESALR
ncbi:potassium channel family protein [Ignicoccus hospitalis]|uniref:TrkA-N domain protein n=1 Tax=Ignicoccus hospitalis (strain KIN4/I / DSM 18386 / JCM 14125) TaxID=453591 RepID=A8A918_IGNH4|nr:TrkA family potassium uptake protein [Ignicoccus hospitalis]ABU81420.1 TrkA-N domain protein [Ignicoccus hospitalis KIN4/I]HIH90273.1 TrkA family potassium uptake protein [Desulfurococcaceae archaeon]